MMDMAAAAAPVCLNYKDPSWFCYYLMSSKWMNAQTDLQIVYNVFFLPGNSTQAFQLVQTGFTSSLLLFPFFLSTGFEDISDKTSKQQMCCRKCRTVLWHVFQCLAHIMITQSSITRKSISVIFPKHTLFSKQNLDFKTCCLLLDKDILNLLSHCPKLSSKHWAVNAPHVGRSVRTSALKSCRALYFVILASRSSL